MKVYILGKISGAYRAQSTISALGDLGIQFAYTPDSYLAFNPSRGLAARVLNLAAFIVGFPIKIALLVRSSHVFLLPMNFALTDLLLIALARILGKQVVVDYYIGLFDSLVNDKRLLKAKSLRARLAKIADQILILLSSKLIFLSNAEKNYYCQIAGVRPNDQKVRIIPLVGRRFAMSSCARKQRPDFTVCWWGSFLPLHGIATILEAIDLLSDLNIRFYFFGRPDDAVSPELKEQIKAAGRQPNVTIDAEATFANGKLQELLLEKCDLALGSFGENSKAQIVMYNKIVDALSLGIPCLTMKTEGLEELAPELAATCCRRDAESIAAAIRDFVLNRKKLLTSEAGRERFDRTFSYEIFCKKLSAALREGC